MSDVVGLALEDDRLEGVVVRRLLGRSRVLGTFTLDINDEPGPTLRARLRELGSRARYAHVAIPRRRSVVKAIELPAVAGVDLPRMVAFELERHLPFAPADAVYDFQVLVASPRQPVRVLLEAGERRLYDRIRQILRDAGLVPRMIDVGIHAVARLVGGRRRGDGRVVVRVSAGEAELAATLSGRVVASRAVPLPPATADPAGRGRTLAAEITRTLEGLSPEQRDTIDEITVVGTDVAHLDWREPPLQTELPLPPGISTGEDGRLPALAVALARPRRGAYPANLVPAEARPRPFPWRVAATAALAVLTLLLAGARPVVTMVMDRRTLRGLDQAVAQLAPEVRRVTELQAQVERARRELQTLRGFEAQSVHVLPVLRELTEALPADVWLTSLSADKSGVELAGFAGSASQLIPLLESSPTLERAEFTSPVTKGRDKEQFRLKAAWERPAGGR